MPFSLILIPGLLGLLVIFSGLAALFFFKRAVVRNKKEFLASDPDLAFVVNPWAEDIAWVKQQPLEELAIRSRDGLKLHGYLLPARSPSAVTVIIAHGYTSKGTDNGCFARFYHEQLGFNVLMPDNRGHGLSEGRYIGFGWPDRLDLLQWVDLAIQRGGMDCQIALHGVSMGGAAVLMVSGETLPRNVKAIISDCAYTSAADILGYQLKRMYKVPAFPLLPLTSLICQLIAGYSLYEASALRQVGKATLPILFIHGGSDTFVPTMMVHPLYAACNSEKKLFLVPGAGHGEAYFKDKPGYQAQVIDFLGKFGIAPKREAAHNAARVPEA